jgi:hypothetical protein
MPCARDKAGANDRFGRQGVRFMPRTFCWITVALIIAAPAWAQSNSGSAQCSGITDPAARLACYDAAQPPRATGPVPANRAPGATRYPEFSNPAQTPEPPPRAALREDSPDTPVRGKLVVGVASFSLSPSGRFTIVLDNGQVWRQVDSDDGIAQFRKQGRNMVAISKGFLWSYDLKLNASSAVFKVTRVK